MIRYTYNSQVQPPAPFVHIRLYRPDGTGDSGELPAQLDTGADRTVIPGSVVDLLQLNQLRVISVAGLGGRLSTAPTYLVQAALREMPPVVLEVLADPGEPYVLLGRDLLNQYRVVLDGPRLTLELE